MGAAPEVQARARIDGLLSMAGWVVQDIADFNRNAAAGVAVREFPLPSGPCDYLLFVGGRACGVIEAKKAGFTLSGVAEQAARYMQDLPAHVARWADRLVFDYESTGDETYFRDTRDPQPRSRRVFAFHPPVKVSIVPSTHREWNMNQAVCVSGRGLGWTGSFSPATC
jgi:type I restriction enzyme R subunit